MPDRIKKKFEQEGQNFDEWVNKYSKFTDFSNAKNLEEWEKLYEKLGSFKAVSKNWSQAHRLNKKPDSRKIMKHLKYKFKKDNRDFNEWVKRFKQYSQKYSQKDINEWEKLFEKLGSFHLISSHIKERNDGKGPHRITIVRRLKAKFKKENRNFNEWVANNISLNTEISARVGKFTHWILELIFIEFCLSKKEKAYFETKVCVQDFETIADNTIIRPFDKIKMVNIDYTISSRFSLILEKCTRNFQGEEKELIIVVLTTPMNISFPKDIVIPFRQNVKLLNFKQFAAYLGYNGHYLNKYNYTISLIIRALYDDNAYKKLEKMGKTAKKKLVALSEEYLLTQTEFEKYLKSGIEQDLSYLLKSSVSDISLDRFIQPKSS